MRVEQSIRALDTRRDVIIRDTQNRVLYRGTIGNIPLRLLLKRLYDKYEARGKTVITIYREE